MKTEAIKSFLRNHYSDESLAALLAHAQDGKLVYDSCCCFIGTATSNHALRSEDCPEFHEDFHIFGVNAGRAPTGHYARAKMLKGADEAEQEFYQLGWPGDGKTADCDKLRRRIVKRLIKAEMKRRERLRPKSAEPVKTEPDHAQVGVKV